MNASNSTNMLAKNERLFSTPMSTFINVLYAIVSLAGFLNSLLVILVFYREQRLRRPLNVILLNLFIADMMFSLSIQPYIWTDITWMTESGTNTGILCAITVALAIPMIFMMPNCLSLIAVTILRYFTIVRNYRGFLVTSKKAIGFFMVSSWLLGLATAVPNLLISGYDQAKSTCYRRERFGIKPALYAVVSTSLFFLGPLLAMLLCYTALALHIWKQSKSSNLNTSVSGRARKSISALLGLLILALLTFWSPLFMVWFLGRALDTFSPDRDGETQRQRWLRVTVLFAALNPVMDPLIYAYSSSEYRAGLTNLLRHLRGRVQVGRRAGVRPIRVAFKPTM